MATGIEYKCPNCGGALVFDSASQKVVCPNCQSEFEVEDVKSYSEELARQKAEDTHWDSHTENFSDEEAEALHVYHCQSCGAEIVADENTSATECPFCNSPVLLTGRLSGVAKPDYVIPFKYDKNSTKEALAKFLKGKLFLPKVFKEENKINDVKGIYEPFWLYTAECEGYVNFRGEKHRTWTSGDYRYEETRYYRMIRSGDIAFDDVPVDGSSTMPDELMESIEPFDFKGGSKEFSAAYLPGYLSNRYDVSKEQCQGRATQRIRQGMIDQFATTVHGYSNMYTEGSQMSYTDTKTSYALYPVWILNSTWQNQKFTFGMNAQTGKMVGNLPLSKAKYALWFALLYVLTGALFGLLGGLFYRAGAEDATVGGAVTAGVIIGLLLGAITPALFCHFNRKALKPVRFKRGAANYYRPDSMNIRYARDIFLYKTVTKTRINYDNKK